MFEIYTATSDFTTVREVIESKDYKILTAELDKIPQNYITLDDEDSIKKMNTLLELLDDNDDVQEVYHNWENVDE